MELELVRTYFPSGTNGKILTQRRLVCFSIELPWKDNHTGVSCIPEGRYALAKRWSPKFGWHLRLTDVPGRSDILIHPANNAGQELKGCIAPVSSLSGAGIGLRSRSALQALISLVSEAFRRKEPVCLTIESDLYEFG
ncbi:MAG TPA: DUF5675 family protein [Puia sp.]|nr:DUF5675 family protein [Puia sp.]